MYESPTIAATLTLAPWQAELEPGLGAPKAAERAESKPDESWLVLEHGVQPVACCSLWWNNVPSPDARPCGAIGHLAWSNPSAAALLLGHALERLAKEQVSQVLAPFDGTLWRSPGWITDSGGRPAFFGEPWNPKEWPKFLGQGRFKPLVVTTALRVDPMTRQPDPLLRRPGCQIRLFNRGRAEAEIPRVYALMMQSDLRNPLFSELDEASFAALYRRKLATADPRLCLMIEMNGTLVATTLASPDHVQKENNRSIDTCIVDWVAASPEEQANDMPMILRQLLESEAARLNYRTLIHGHLSADVLSRFLSMRHGTPLRRYGLFHSEL